MKTIGILSLQGDFEKHYFTVKKTGAKPVYIRSVDELSQIDGLIIPGGESTTIGKLMVRFNLMEKIKDLIISGLPVFGTCAGLILLSKEIKNSDQPRIGLMNITVERNAYGRQINSFESDIMIFKKKETIRGVFIRAPKIIKINKNIEVIAEYDNIPILVREKNMLGASFHPELTDNTMIHKYFLEMIK